MYLKKISITVLSLSFLLCPSASAHSPEGFALAGISMIFIGAVLAGAAKFYLIKKLKGIKLKLKILFGNVVIELIVMIFFLIFMSKYSPINDTRVILLGGCVLYYVVDVIINLSLFKEDNQKFKNVIVVSNIKLATLLGVIYPAILILLAITIFIPLYIFFGG